MARLTRRTLAAALALAGAVGSCSGPAPRSRGATATANGTVSSNVRFADYAGTRACARCHEEYVERWLRSPMHNMTREARAAKVRGPFDGTTFKFRDDSAKLETAGADRFMSIHSRRFGDGIYKLTRVIGGHHREDYAGVRVAEVQAGAKPTSAEELVLPVSFVYATQSLRYKGFSVMVKERDGLRAGPTWNQTCIFCHNTVPYLSTVLGALAGTSGYQGEVVDPLLPATLRAKYVVTDEGALRGALHDEIARLGSDADPTLREAISTTRYRFDAKHLVEVGIGCESCHLGAAEHARDPKRLPSFEPISEAFAVRLPEKGRRAQALNRVCARCHQVLFSGYDPTWEGGSRKRGPGGSHINSGEARDLMLGACAEKLTCVDCHDPHEPDGTATLRKLAPEKEDALCTRCHSKLTSNEALRAHSHHDPARQGGRCLSCHMPRKNMSLDGTLSRYHRIGSPTDAEKVLLDRPLECALCHGDKSVESLAHTMETWWKKAYDRDALTKAYGSLDANVLLATAERGKPHEQAVAFQLLGDAKVAAAIPILATQLTHPYPIVRGYAKRALESIRRVPLPIDIDAADAVIEEEARQLH